MITKTNYVDFTYCPRCFYYSIKHPNEAKPTDDHTKAIIDKGILVGKVAFKYFPNTYRVKGVGDKPNLEHEIMLTQDFINNKVEVIAEASFKYDDLFCAVDILKRNNDGSYDIYEVKACGDDIKKHLKEYYPDVAFQKYVLTKCGLKINHSYILHLNGSYVRNGEINVQELLTPYLLDNDQAFNEHYKHVDMNLDDLRRLLSANGVPEYGENCTSDCPFMVFCHKDLPFPNIISINGIRKKKAHEFIKQGIITYQDALRSGTVNKTNNFRKDIQMKIGSSNLTRYVNKDELKHFLKALKYPLYHLDFETYSEPIPPFDGARPYQVVPFQYSLHIEASPGGEVVHKEFLADKFNALKELAEQLCKDIPMNMTTIAFHASTETGIMKKLADMFPTLHDHLMNIVNHTVDLIEPFKKGYFYDIKQGSSNSIKVVMPALCPHMEEAYHNLPFVHNGGEAMTAFPLMMEMDKNSEEYIRKRKGMLSYCELDTLSMVEILKVLWNSINDN